MYISRLAFVLAALSAASCIDKDVDNTEFYEKYARGFDNRTTVAVNIASEVAGEYYAVYFGNPYDGAARPIPNDWRTLETCIQRQ